MLVLAQSYGFAKALIVLAVLLGLVAVCVPRPRKRFTSVDKRKKLKRRQVR